MDNARLSAIVGLFSPDGVPEDDHVVELKKNPKMADDERDELLITDIDAFNNFDEFCTDGAATFLASFRGSSKQRQLIQRLAGLPEEAPAADLLRDAAEPILPTTPPVIPAASIAIDDIGDGEDEEDEEGDDNTYHGPIVNPDPSMDDRRKGLMNIFDQSDNVVAFCQADVEAIGHRWHREDGDADVLSAECIEQMKRLELEGEDYVDGIDETTHPSPKYTDAQRAELKNLLRQLLAKTGPIVIPKTNGPELQFSDPNPAPAPSPPPVPQPLQVIRNPPAWAISVLGTSVWDKSRERIEFLFAQTKNPDQTSAAHAHAGLRLWDIRIQEMRDGCAGPDLIRTGEYLTVLMRDLRVGVDPASLSYKSRFVGS